MADETPVTPTATPAAPAPQPDEGLLHELATSAGLDPEAIVATAKAIRQHPWQVAKEVGSAQAGEFVDAGHHLRDTALSALNGVASAITNPEAKATAIARLKSPGLINKIQGAEEYATAAVPLVGGNYVKAEEQAGRGNIAGSIGTTLGTTLPLVTDTEGAEGIKAHLAETGKTFVESAKEGMQRAAVATAPEGSAEAGFAKIPGSKKVRGAIPSEAKPQGPFLHHVTDAKNLDSIRTGGLQTGMPSNWYDQSDNVFLTHPKGADFWNDKVKEFQKEATGEEGETAELRVSKKKLMGEYIQKDEMGSEDAQAPAYQYGDPIPAKDLEIKTPTGKWEPLVTAPEGSAEAGFAKIPGSKKVRGATPKPTVTSGEDVVTHIQNTTLDKISREEAHQRAGLDSGGDYRLTDIPTANLEAGDDYDPKLAQKYADKKGPLPAIVLDGDGRIRDGNHRVAAAQLRGEPTVKAYVPIDATETAPDKLAAVPGAKFVGKTPEPPLYSKIPGSRFSSEGAKFVGKTPAPPLYSKVPGSRFSSEGAQPLADHIGAQVVGSVATKGASTHDLDLKVDNYDQPAVEAAMKEKGFEPIGSSVLSPKEIKASGKDFGTAADEWARAHHFESTAEPHQKVDVWHKEAAEPVSAPAETAPAAEYHPDLQKIADKFGTHTDPTKIADGPSFIAPDGKFIPLGSTHHDVAIDWAQGSKGSTREAPDNRVAFINDSKAVRVRPATDKGGTTLHISVPREGISPEQIDALKQGVAKGLGYGNVMMETADNPRDIKTAPYKELATDTDIEPMLKEIGAHPDQQDIISKELQSAQKEPYTIEVTKSDGTSTMEHIDAFSSKNAIATAQKKFPNADEWRIEKYGERQSSSEYSVPTGKRHKMPESYNRPEEDTERHEVAHALVALKEGLQTGGVLTSRHPVAPSDARAVHLLKGEGLRDPATGHIRADKRTAVLASGMAGIASDELRGVPRAVNPNFFIHEGGDGSSAYQILTAAGFTHEAALTEMHRLIDENVEYLKHPAYASVVNENVGFREKDLSRQFHYSPERLQNMHAEIERRKANGETTGRDNGPSDESITAGREGDVARGKGEVPPTGAGVAPEKGIVSKEKIKTPEDDQLSAHEENTAKVAEMMKAKQEAMQKGLGKGLKKK